MKHPIACVFGILNIIIFLCRHSRSDQSSYSRDKTLVSSVFGMLYPCVGSFVGGWLFLSCRWLQLLMLAAHADFSEEAGRRRLVLLLQGLLVVSCVCCYYWRVFASRRARVCVCGGGGGSNQCYPPHSVCRGSFLSFAVFHSAKVRPDRYYMSKS